MADFKERFTLLRKEMHLSQREIASKLNLTHGTVGLYESGKRKPSSDKLNEIADFFNVSLDYLTGKSELRNNNTWYTISENGVEELDLKKYGIELNNEEDVEKFAQERFIFKDLNKLYGITYDEFLEVKNYIKYLISKR